MSKEFVAGISFAGNQGRLAILEIKHGDIRVRYLQEFQRESESTVWFIEALTGARERILRKGSRVSLALDSSSTFLHTFPMDCSLSQSEQNDQVRWELSQLISDFHPKEYAQDVHLLQTHAIDRVSDMLVVAVKRTLISAIQTALVQRKYELHSVDTDHFGGQYALLTNYPEVKTKTVALVNLSGQRIDAGIIGQGRLVRYGFRPVSPVVRTEEYLQEFLGDASVEKVFLFGADVRPAVYDELEDQIARPVSLLDPFRRLRISRKFKNFEAFGGREHTFAAAVGCALLK